MKSNNKNQLLNLEIKKLKKNLNRFDKKIELNKNQI
jgi:hypothetical protein